MAVWTKEEWDEWFNHKDEKSLSDLLEGFYKGFDIADYLDQIGIIDDRLDDLTKSLESIMDLLMDDNAFIDRGELVDDLALVQMKIDNIHSLDFD